MNLPKRKPMRYKNFDYSQCGSYFLTISTQNRKNLFWDMEKVYSAKQANELEHIINPDFLPLNYAGKIVEKHLMLWQNTYSNVKLENFVIMPNHIHLIVSILENESESKKTDISRMVAQFKGCVTKELGEAIWQKGYFDHIIANEKDFNNCFDYIEANPYILEEKILEQRKKKMKQ